MQIERAIQQNKFRSPQQKAVLNLLYTVSWLTHRQQSFFKRFGTTAQQFNILRILRGQAAVGISAKEIKKRMLDRNSDVSRLLDRLALKGLVERRLCPNDKRAADVFITPGGMTLLSKIDPHIDSADQLINITDEEALQLSNLLDKCRDRRED